MTAIRAQLFDPGGCPRLLAQARPNGRHRRIHRVFEGRARCSVMWGAEPRLTERSFAGCWPKSADERPI
jgi:hypothetical protein